MRCAVSRIAAIGRVIRRARYAETNAATSNAIAPVRNRYGPARPNGRVSTPWASTSAGVVEPTGLNGSTTNAVLPVTPDCCCPTRI